MRHWYLVVWNNKESVNKLLTSITRPRVYGVFLRVSYRFFDEMLPEPSFKQTADTADKNKRIQEIPLILLLIRDKHCLRVSDNAL